MRAWLALAFGLCSGAAGLADAPKSSVRPLPRPALTQPVAAIVPDKTATTLPDLARMRPLHRPVATAQAMPVAAAEQPRKGLPGLITPRAKPAKQALASGKGAVCGVPSIKGKTLPRITSKTKGCGIEDPVSVKSVDGAKLSTPATMDCNTAIALNTWVQKSLRPAFPSADVASLTVVDSYSCRLRNNVRGNKISEHGKGHAIDIAGITFTNGKSLTVSRNFKTLRKAYKAGCGIFGTTLGPGSDGYHEDHMHFDTARQRGGGAYCR